MQIFVHNKCAHSKELTEWMLENVTEDLQYTCELISATPSDNIEYVPCISYKGKEAVGFKQCRSLLENYIEEHSKKPTQKKLPDIADLPSQYKPPPKAQSVEDKFNDLISARKPPSTGAPLPVPERSVPAL